MSDNFLDAVDRIYEKFLMRDLTYVFGGSLLLISIQYVREGNLINTIDYISQNLIIFIIFLGISYVAGYVVFTGVMFLKIFDTVKDIYTPHNEIKILADILEKYGHDTIKRIERENYLERFARTIGSASLISSCVLIFSFIMYYRFVDLIISLILVVITIVCLKENKRWIKKLRENIVHLDIGVGPPPLLADR